MKKYGIGSGIFTIIFGIVFGFAAFMFFSIVAGVGSEDVDSVFLGALLALAFIPLIISGGVGIISGFITIILFITTVDRVRSAIKQAKFKRQQAANQS
ncbi:MAG: hypothetical protein ACTSRE_11345 [Promethearchaeota archaeon]